MEDKKVKTIRRKKKGPSSTPNRKRPSKESWEKLKETALEKGWIKKP
jgi:hypothetical protein